MVEVINIEGSGVGDEGSGVGTEGSGVGDEGSGGGDEESGVGDEGSGVGDEGSGVGDEGSGGGNEESGGSGGDEGSCFGKGFVKGFGVLPVMVDGGEGIKETWNAWLLVVPNTELHLMQFLHHFDPGYINATMNVM